MTAVVSRRPSGPAGLEVPAMALGSWHTWDRAVFEEAVQIVKRAVDVGAAMFDVGVYRAGFDTTPHDSPTDIVLARAVQVAGVSRADYVLSVKGWLGPDSSASNLGMQVDEVLLRHGTDHADLMILGGIADESAFDVEAVVERVHDVVRAGKVRYWGINNWSAANVRAAQEAARRQGLDAPQVAQMVYGLAHRTVCEGEPFTALCAETGLSLQASNVFDGGVLLGKGTDRHVAGDIHGTQAAIRAAQSRLGEVARSLGATPAQFGFALPLTHPATVNVLVGLRTMGQLEDLIGAFALVERLGADRIREAADEFWFDRGRADPASGGE
ncbi:MAG: aldo/keto reductase [Pseudonocardia sp.]